MNTRSVNLSFSELQPYQLDALCTLRRELVEPSSARADRYVGLEHLDSSRSHIRRWGTQEGLRSTKSRFYTGDILYGKLRPYLDKAAVAEWGGVCSTDILTLQPRLERADPHYLSFLFHTEAFLAHAAATTVGVNHPRTSWASMANFVYFLPPLAEQRGISTVLSKLEAAVELQDKMIMALKDLKTTTMAKLFREGLRGEPLKQTEIGEIPECWEIVRLGDHCRISSGGTPARDVAAYWNGTTPWVKTAEIDYRPILTTEERITETGLRDSSAKLLPTGTLLMAMYGQGVTRGKVAVLQIEAATNQACEALFPDETLDSGYLYAFCVRAYDAIRELGHGANQKNLSADIIREIRVPRPPSLEEQREIYRTLRSVERRIEAAVKIRDVRETMFSSVLHLLMTGQVRVTTEMIAREWRRAQSSTMKRGSGAPDERTVQEIVRRIVEAVSPEKIILFGSAARGEMGPDSDIDLLVVKACDAPREVERRIYRELIGIGIPKDVLVVTPGHLEKHKDTIGYIYRSALREGRIVYAR
jgi:type I restriction enzyme S subunit